jgi:anti-sigma regulatory factor (Ser/Thr protein kinase)
MPVGAAVANPRPTAGYRHEVLMYSSLTEFVRSTADFIRAGVDTGEPVLVVLNQDKIDAITAELGRAAATQVAFADMAVVGANPGRIIGAWHAYLSRHGRSRGPIRGIGEPVHARRGVAELAECQLHEALLNVAFCDWDDFWLLCPYDLSTLSDQVVAEALRSHPYVACGSDRRASALYQEPDPLTLFEGELPAPPSDAVSARFNHGDLDAVRDLVADQAGKYDFGPTRTADIVTAVNELATNAIEHGGGEGIVRVWREADAVLFEISDRGRFDAPLAGRIPPSTSSSNGRGMWIANQLCDLLQVRSLAYGTAIRAHLRLGVN